MAGASIQSLILGPDGKPFRAESSKAPKRETRQIRARYAAAQTNEANRLHWESADALSARSANSPMVRYILRNRARLEAAENNCYLWGMVETLANDTIGTGPRLQMLTDDRNLNERLEKAWSDWSHAISLGDKLLEMCQARVIDGEAFALMDTNPALLTPAQLDLRLVEADQVATPTIDPLNLSATDGIVFDDFGNPIEYHVLQQHPGDSFGLGLKNFDRIPARFVLHWFRRRRIGQLRGIPEITPALPLVAYMRRYTLAVVDAAETAAQFSAALESTMPPDDDDPEGMAPLETADIERGVMTVLPDGYKFNPLQPTQPTTNYPDFKRELLNESARCLNMPYNIAAGNSAGYNYSSGRLDHQIYYKSLRVQRRKAECMLDRVFGAWLDEMSLATDLIPGGPDRLEGWPHQWFWDGPEHVDPEKEANAQAIRLKNNTATLADEFARRGQDWEAQLRQRAKELALMRELGIPLDTSPGQPSGQVPQQQQQQQPQYQPAGGDDGDPPEE